MPTITIDLTAQQAQRLQDALTVALELGQPATITDAQDFIKLKLKQLVVSTERQAVRAQADSTVTDFDPSVT